MQQRFINCIFATLFHKETALKNQLKMKKIFSFYLLLALTVSMASCDKEDEPDDPIIPNQEEVITTLTYTLTPVGEGNVVVFSFQDLDGDGGNDPVLTEGTLAANTVYAGALVLLNETESPAEDITLEVEEEADEHQFFFSSTLSDLSVSYTDTYNGNPLGITSELTTGAAGSGVMTVILRHEPNKDAEGVADGDITNAGGETDIEVDFTVNVE